MNYPKFINETLRPKLGKYLVLDLFAGCGGLALGFEARGFKTIGYEMNQDCCMTYRKNLFGDCHNVELTKETDYPNADVVIGGPPCQPFSVGGKQLGLSDSRDGFPIFIEAVKKVQPSIFMFENVRGILFRNKDYFEEILDELELLNYTIEKRIINTANYDVPQRRERVIVIGHKAKFNFPKMSNREVSSGEALGRLAYSVNKKTKFVNKSMDKYIAKYEKASKCINPRDLNFNKPSRTVTCRNLAGATGDMLRIKLKDGRRKRLSVKEGARLQSFPDWFKFCGGEQSQFNQIGNAVPPMMAYNLADSLYEYLESVTRDNKLSIKLREKQLQLV